MNWLRAGLIKRRHLSWTLANFDRVDTPILQAFRMSTGIFARSRARPGPTKNPTYPHILGHSARPPFRKLAKVELMIRRERRGVVSGLAVPFLQLVEPVEA